MFAPFSPTSPQTQFTLRSPAITPLQFSRDERRKLAESIMAQEIPLSRHHLPEDMHNFRGRTMAEIAALVLGAFFMFVASLGVLRLGDFLTHIPAPTKAATLGPAFFSRGARDACTLWGRRREDAARNAVRRNDRARGSAYPCSRGLSEWSAPDD